MKNKRRHIMVAVLAVALGFLAVDRLFLEPGVTGPETAEAAASDATSNAEKALAAIESGSSEPLQATSSLARRLDTLASAANLDQTQCRDAFTASPSWVGTPKVSEQPRPQAEGTAEQFVRHHRLNAVLVGPGGGVATVSSVPLRVGQSIDGFTLIEVVSDGVVFRGPDGTKATLYLDGTSDVSGGE